MSPDGSALCVDGMWTMKKHVELVERSSAWLGTLAIAATASVAFSPEECAVIREQRMEYRLILNATPKEVEFHNADLKWIITVRSFLPNGTHQLRFDNWSDAHNFKAKLDNELEKL